MFPSVNLKTDTNIKLPLSFILYALLAFVTAQVILFINTDYLSASTFRIPDIWMGAHFLLLGFALMIVMGAMYQLVPVAFLTPIWNERFGFVQFTVTASGITAFSILLGVNPDKAIYGGIPTVIGVMMFIIQMINTIFKQEQKNPNANFVLGALASLTLTITAGFLLALNLGFGGILRHQSIFYSHITFGVAGWFTLLIIGFSYKLVPMFSLSHGFSMKWAKPAFFTYISGLTVLIISFWIELSHLNFLGWLLLFVGFLFFGLDMKEILDKRMKKRLDKPFFFSLCAMINGLIIHFYAFLFSLLGISNRHVWSWLIFLYIVGWIMFSIFGYLYKIVPFLWWTHKYSERIGKEKVPNLKDMIDEKLSVVLFTAFTVCLIGLVAGGLWQISLMVYIFQGIFTVTSLVYTLSIIRVLFI